MIFTHQQIAMSGQTSQPIRKNHQKPGNYDSSFYIIPTEDWDSDTDFHFNIPGMTISQWYVTDGKRQQILDKGRHFK